MEGFGTELGLANLFLCAAAAAFVAYIRNKVRILLKTDLEKELKRHRLMWKGYVRDHIDDTGKNLEELL